MKTRIAKITTLFAVLATVLACTEDMEYKDVNVSPVDQLYEPTDGKTVQLEASASASLYFEWASAKTEDGGAALYEVVFDKVGGDFSNPIYKVLSDDNGMRNYATITHKTLNSIGAAAGLKGGETGTLIWSVIASRGLNTVKGSVSRQLTITRLVGFAEVPSQLYLTGEATEGGTDITQAVACSSPESGVFEIFTRLQAGKTYKLVDKNAEGANSYYINGKSIAEGDGESTVDEDGVYRIIMDFSVASATFYKIESLGLWHCWDQAVIFDLDYQGNGVFEGTGLWKTDASDNRYKFLMTYADGTKIYWGTLNTTDAVPNGAGADNDYYLLKEYTGTDNQWDHKWKIDNDLFNQNIKVTVKFNNSKYTHFIEAAE